MSPICAEDDTDVNNDTNVNDTVIIITEETLIDHIDETNTLNSSFENKTIEFQGEFDDWGTININAKNATIRGNENAVFKNTVFAVNEDYVTIENITMNLTYPFEDNSDSGIFINGDYATINNITMYYVVPKDVTAYGIYSQNKKNTRIVNNTIYFEAHNNNGGTDYAIYIDNSPYALIENNTLDSSFPLRNINFETGGKNHVLGICIENSDYFALKNNNLTVIANKRPACEFPTLVGVRIANSNWGLVKNNTLYMEDFETNVGLDNYLYAMDIHNLHNLTIDSNDIDVYTWGGVLRLGTAYGIQLTGPIDDTNITHNDIYSISNGPNLGIYSQNVYGHVSLVIDDNDINITGLAGKDYWALVAGIEVQDDDDTITNNRISVHSVGEVEEGDNLFGISYRQKTEGNHTFDIENNLVFSEGYYSTYLESSVGSTIKNNMLVTSREDAEDKTPYGYKEGPGEHIKDTYYNNTVVNEYHYWTEVLHGNEIDGGENTTYVPPENVNNRTNTVDGRNVDPTNNNPNYNSNPLNPGNGEKPVKPNVDPDKNTPGANGTNPNGGINDYTDSTGSDLDDYTYNDSNTQTDDYTKSDSELDDYTNATRNNNVDDYTKADSELEDYTNSSSANVDDYTNATKQMDDYTDQTDVKTEDFTNSTSSNTDDYTMNSTSENVDYTNDNQEVIEDWEDYTNHETNNRDSEWEDYTRKQSNPNKQSANGTYIDDSSNPQNNGISLPDSNVPSNMTSNTEGGDVITNSNNGELIKTNSSTPSITGEESAKSKDKTSQSSNSETSSPSAAGAQAPTAASAADVGSVNAYEITKSITDHTKQTDMVLPILLGMLVLVLLIIGYRRKSDDEDY